MSISNSAVTQLELLTLANSFASASISRQKPQHEKRENWTMVTACRSQSAPRASRLHFVQRLAAAGITWSDMPLVVLPVGGRGEIVGLRNSVRRRDALPLARIGIGGTRLGPSGYEEGGLRGQTRRCRQVHCALLIHAIT